MQFTLYNVFASAITSIGIIGGILLLTQLINFKKGSKKANFFLLLLVSIMTLRMLQNFVLYSGFHAVFPHFIFATFPLRALIGPFIFLYVYYLIYPNRLFKWHILLHLILFVYIFYAGHWAFLFSSSTDKINAFEWFSNPNNKMEGWGFNFMLLILCLQLGYILTAYWLIVEKRKLLIQTSANTALDYLNTFKKLVIGSGIYIFITIIAFISLYLFEIAPYKVEFLLFLPNSILLIILAVLNLKQPDRFLFALQFSEPINRVKENHPIRKENLFNQQLKEIMETHQPYRNPELRIHDLAKLANISVRKLSDQINKEMGTNFFDFINQYRVAAFKKLVVNPRYANFTLLAIAQEVGFNSKASFNRIFKKHTGLTPSQFIHSQKVSSSVVEPPTA